MTMAWRSSTICLPRPARGQGNRTDIRPDFILWIRNKNTKSVRVVFLDPHGLHHEGIVDNDRFAAIEKLRVIGANKKFGTKRIELDGYILAPADTSPDKIPGAKGKTWEDLEKDYPLFRQEGSYVEKIFSSMP
ncbi:MAG: hypothetical protein PHT49_08930 [Desulfovibrionales bacterium]|nr:hypothetical protein [Desulfovibrionales bacterium]